MVRRPRGRYLRGATPQKREFARSLRQRMTPAEQVLWKELRRLRPEGLVFRRQVALWGYVVDFHCPALKLVVEVDGLIHRTTREYDQVRDAALERRGLTVIRVTNKEVMEQTDETIARILDLAE